MFGIDDAVSAVSGLADTVIRRVWPDATEVEKIRLQQLADSMEQEFKLRAKQIAVNIQEAQSANVFVSGWRPFVGWVCGSALAYAALIEPVARFVAVVAFGYSGAFPVIDTSLTLQILLGLLGLAGYRTLEKHKGVARK